MSEVKNEGLEVVTRNFKTREGYDVWDKLCSIPKYGFLIGPSGGVAKVLDIGNWIDRDEAQSVVDVAQTELNEARAEALAGYAVLRERIADLQAELVRQAIDNNELRAELAELKTQLGNGTTGNKYKAELYDEVWQKATGMGYSNVTMALAELAAIKAREPVLPCELDLESSFACAEKEASLHAGTRDLFYFALIECLQTNKLYAAPVSEAEAQGVVMPSKETFEIACKDTMRQGHAALTWMQVSGAQAIADQRDRLAGLLRESLAAHRMWADVAPAVSLCADIEKALADLPK